MFFQILSSGILILLAIFLEIKIILQNILRRVVVNSQINISPSNVFLIMLLPARFHQSCQEVFGRCEHEWVKKECCGYQRRRIPDHRATLSIHDY